MKILSKDDVLTKNLIDLDYFHSHSEIAKSYTTESYWNRDNLDVFDLTYKISYVVKDPGSDDYFINYQRSSALKCQIGDLSDAATEVINMNQYSKIVFKVC